MSRIIKGLKQAVRYARGDKTAGKPTLVVVPLPDNAVTRLAGAFPGETEMTVIGDEDDMTILTEDAAIRRRIIKS